MKPTVVAAMFVFFLAEAYLPCALKQMDTPSFLKMSWRAQASMVLLIPMACVEILLRGESGWFAYRKAAPRLLRLCFGVGCCWLTSFCALTVALTMTSLAHATLCAVAMPPVFLTLYAVLVKREKAPPLELIGVGLAVAGIALAEQDTSSAEGGAGMVGPTVAGDLVALGSALAAAGFGILISRVRNLAPEVPPIEFQAAWQACILPMALALPVLHGDVGGSGAGQGHNGGGGGGGVFGLADWLLHGVYWPQMLFLAIGMGIFAQASIAFVVQEAGPLPYGLVMCACPAGSSLLGWLLGQQRTPGACTIVGGAVVLAGLVTVLMGTEARAKQHGDSAAHMRTPALPAVSSKVSLVKYALSPSAMSASPSGATAAQFLVTASDEPAALPSHHDYQRFPPPAGAPAWLPKWVKLPGQAARAELEG